MKSFILTTLVFVLMFSCNNSKNKTYSAFDKQKEGSEHPGKKLMEINCYVCHSPTASEEDRIGPPMIAIKKHYITDNTSKSDFVAAIQTWIKNPNEEDAKMYGAVKRFGVMPKTPYPEETIAQIADYMFENDIAQPEWFEDHYNKERGMHKGKGMGNGMGKRQVQTNFQDLPYAERGLKYALTTKAVLGENLMGTIQKKGTLEALAFCNAQAYPLTDSMAVVHNAKIKRVSDKPRNINNQANTEELQHIKTFKQVIANKEEPKPIVKETNNKVKVYYPITTNAMCLQCHGTPNKTINKATLEKLTSLYPKDKAIGYNINEVRGIWSITFDK
jgi:nitrate reductase cytochrome c-type subunit